MEGTVDSWTNNKIKQSSHQKVQVWDVAVGTPVIQRSLEIGELSTVRISRTSESHTHRVSLKGINLLVAIQHASEL